MKHTRVLRIENDASRAQAHGSLEDGSDNEELAEGALTDDEML